ncbi:hypothetical protein [Rugamonas apoptosis]|uniref:Uncharacterized protein n=1 Tax=Rugamonas apoptosis TaxID=2758570 RepID=A0A7W2IJN9_9BURK|nr:hypothetical protein [Rugamonas apoptosis]MBA5686719.1 hypothetical protein [Rugamonas apoptosis]
MPTIALFGLLWDQRPRKRSICQAAEAVHPIVRHPPAGEVPALLPADYMVIGLASMEDAAILARLQRIERLIDPLPDRVQ